MIQTIEINITSGPVELISALIVFEKNICYINNKKYSINEEFKELLLRDICYWENEYGYDDNIDSEEFTIKVITQNGEEKYHGKGRFPYNYTHLKELLGTLYE